MLLCGCDGSVAVGFVYSSSPAQIYYYGSNTKLCEMVRVVVLSYVGMEMFTTEDTTQIRLQLT